MPWSEPAHADDVTAPQWAASLAVLWLPVALLGFESWWAGSLPIAAGAGVLALFAAVFVGQHPVWRPPVGASVVVLYLMALVWSWLPVRTVADPALYAVQGALILVGVGLFAAHDLIRSGAEPLRRANTFCRRLVGRTEWPLQLVDCRHLPEVRGLRHAVRDVAGPALALLSDPRAEVQAAALGALEYRQDWHAGEAELVLRIGMTSPEPGVRAAAAYALAGIDSADLVAGLAGMLRDPAPEVRRAAAEALLWDGDRRWPFAREAVHAALSDARLANDGPLFVGTVRLPAAAVCDLTLWAADRPPLATRATQILVEQYHRGLSDPDRPELASELAAQTLDDDAAPNLRVELASLLRDHHMLTPDLLDRLTNVGQPGPLRLLAAEVMLRANPNDPDGLDVLRGLARQPNREMALAVGAILQNILGLNLGLPQGHVPAANSKAAADVTRRVLAWANGATPDMVRPPTPGPHPGLKPGSRSPFGGLQSTNFEPPPGKRKV